MKELSKRDIASLKRIINRAVLDKRVREALSEGRLPPGKWQLSENASKVLQSITSQELEAVASMYYKVERAGASKADLKDAIVL